MWKSEYKENPQPEVSVAFATDRGSSIFSPPHNHDLKANKNALKANQNRGHETLPVFSAVNSWIAVSVIL